MYVKTISLEFISRKSFHGYPPGMAQLIDSPTSFHIQPMQIDTKNRFYNGTDFKPGLLPKSSKAPANASYSGLLECPCTTRIHKEINVTYDAQNNGTCHKRVETSAECFRAAHLVNPNLGNETQIVVDKETIPSGCSILRNKNGSVAVVFNKRSQGTNCGEGSDHWTGSSNSATIDVSVFVDLKQLPSNNGIAKITVTGPSSVWFGVAFGAKTFTMSDEPYTIIADGNGNVYERKLGNHDGGTKLSPSINILSNRVVDGKRSVLITRSFKGKSNDYYTFDPSSESTISILSASGEGPNFSYHGPKTRGGSSIQLIASGSYSCICNSGIKGSINGIPFNRVCRPEPFGDLVRQQNPTCSVQSYQGGLFCCHHQNVLLDADQEQPDDVFSYHMKFRFYFQPYQDSNLPDKPPSHNNLIRLYYQTEAYAGEYDIPQADPHSPPEDNIHTITANFKVESLYFVFHCTEFYGILLRSSLW